MLATAAIHPTPPHPPKNLLQSFFFLPKGRKIGGKYFLDLTLITFIIAKTELGCGLGKINKPIIVFIFVTS
jgi:hypothetical protein